MNPMPARTPPLPSLSEADAVYSYTHSTATAPPFPLPPPPHPSLGCRRRFLYGSRSPRVWKRMKISPWTPPTQTTLSLSRIQMQIPKHNSYHTVPSPHLGNNPYMDPSTPHHTAVLLPSPHRSYLTTGFGRNDTAKVWSPAPPLVSM